MKRSIHFRRCHVCGTLNYREGARVERCQGCERSFAPFYYFDERFVAAFGDSTLRPPLLENEYHPVMGLTAYWDF